ncbi:Kinesin-like protein [Giardia lamblia P15]|uniref:Kinesin-like protein n=1 Tax=Giardia intestinalis (strain P15) TaxID=658858 RepID=E1EWS7_GIAIA|nr:Kinesin-like protein [Giardia lamblia P15]
MQRHVKVYARLRPPISVDEITTPQCLFSQDCTVVVRPPFANVRSFTLDGVYGPNVTSVDVHDSSLGPLVADFLDGYSCTCFVYGQTGSGKTHTMGFEANSPALSESRPDLKEDGVCGIFFNRLFHKLQYGLQRYNFANSQLLLSMVQIYNDELEDLLFPHRRISLREVGGSFYISNATCVSVSTATDAMAVVRVGLQNRVIAPTMMNKSSSRSHTVLCVALCKRVIGDKPSSQLFVTSAEYLKITSVESSGITQGVCYKAPRANSATPASTKERKKSNIPRLERHNSAILCPLDELHSTNTTRSFQTYAKKSAKTQFDAPASEAIFYLCDLAGSERVKASKSDGVRFSEATHINQSLSALGNVVSALSKQALGKKVSHVPYRDSLLTKLLKPSLAGESRMVAIVTLSPDLASLSETLSTLAFAERCKSLPDWSRPKSLVTDMGSVSGCSSSIEINSRAITEAYLSSLGVPLSKLEKHLPDVLLLLNRDNSSQESQETIAILAGENTRLRACIGSLMEPSTLPKIHTLDTRKLAVPSNLRAKCSTHAEEFLYSLLVNQCFRIDNLYQQVTASLLHTRTGLVLQQIAASYVKLRDYKSEEKGKSTLVVDSKPNKGQIPEDRFIEVVMKSKLLCESIQMLYDQGNDVTRFLLDDVLTAHTDRLHREWTSLARRTVIPPFSYFRDPEKLVKFIAELFDVASKELDRIEKVFAGKQAEIDFVTAYANMALVQRKKITQRTSFSEVTQSSTSEGADTSVVSTSYPLSPPSSPGPQRATSLSWLADLPPRPDSTSSDSAF